MNILLSVILEFSSSQTEETGFFLFLAAIIILFISIIGFITSAILKATGKEESFKKGIKFSLICLLMTGILLILTSILCGWYG